MAAMATVTARAAGSSGYTWVPYAVSGAPSANASTTTVAVFLPTPKRSTAIHSSRAASTPAITANVAFAASHPPSTMGPASSTGSRGSWGLNSRPSSSGSVWGSRVTSWNGS